MEEKHQVRLGAVQETLFIPLAARALETARKRPVLRDPKAVEMVRSIDYDAAKYGRAAGGSVTVLRTAIIDFWVRGFLSEADLRPAAPAGRQEGHECPVGLALRRSALAGAVRAGGHGVRLDHPAAPAMRSQLPARYRYLMPLGDPVLGKTMAITLFRASSPGAAG